MGVIAPSPVRNRQDRAVPRQRQSDRFVRHLVYGSVETRGVGRPRRFSFYPFPRRVAPSPDPQATRHPRGPFSHLSQADAPPFPRRPRTAIARVRHSQTRAPRSPRAIPGWPFLRLAAMTARGAAPSPNRPYTKKDHTT
jgi:hypothetical protein